jgi:hypothetical protein
MKGLLRYRPSPAMVVALLALFVALSAGAAANLPGLGVVNSGDIKNNSIRSKDIRNRNIRGKDVKKNTLGGATIKESSLKQVPDAANADNATRFGGALPGAFEPAKQFILIGADGTTRLAGSPGVSIEAGSGATFTYIDFGRSVANRLILATSARAAAATTNNDVSVTPCGGAAAAPGGSTCAVGNDVNHVLVRKGTAGQPYYVGVF